MVTDVFPQPHNNSVAKIEIKNLAIVTFIHISCLLSPGDNALRRYQKFYHLYIVGMARHAPTLVDFRCSKGSWKSININLYKIPKNPKFLSSTEYRVPSTEIKILPVHRLLVKAETC